MAGELLDAVLVAFADGNGGFYDTAADGERLIFRPADPTDNATPSGAFAAADALVSYGALTGDERYRTAALDALRVLPPIAGKYPRACGTGLAVAEALLSGPTEVAIVGPRDDPRTADLLRAALHVAPPGAVFALGTGSEGEPGVPAAGEARPLSSPRSWPAATCCHGFTCQAPVTTTEALRETLRAPDPRGTGRLIPEITGPAWRYSFRLVVAAGTEVDEADRRCNHDYMSTEIRAWFAGRLPGDWYAEPAEVTIDREEITVTGSLSAPESDDADAAAEGRIKRFREDTRARRIEIASEAERKFGRKVAWGASCGTLTEMFTTLSVPVMTRLRQPERRVLDTLVDAGVAQPGPGQTRWPGASEGSPGSMSTPGLSELREALRRVEEVRSQGPQAQLAGPVTGRTHLSKHPTQLTSLSGKAAFHQSPVGYRGCGIWRSAARKVGIWDTGTWATGCMSGDWSRTWPGRGSRGTSV